MIRQFSMFCRSTFCLSVFCRSTLMTVPTVSYRWGSQSMKRWSTAGRKWRSDESSRIVILTCPSKKILQEQILGNRAEIHQFYVHRELVILSLIMRCNAVFGGITVRVSQEGENQMERRIEHTEPLNICTNTLVQCIRWADKLSWTYFVLVFKIQIMSQCIFSLVNAIYDVCGMRRYTQNMLKWTKNKTKSTKMTQWRLLGPRYLYICAYCVITLCTPN